MGAFAFWISLPIALLLLIRPLTRNAGWFAAVGSIVGGFYHFDYADVIDFHNFALYMWAFALFLAAAKQFPGFGRWSAHQLDLLVSTLLSLRPKRSAS